METPMVMAGLVLCGGASTRMGTEKALMQFDGEPLIRRVARRLASVASPVLLATGVRGRLGDLGYEEVEDVVAGAGPLSGLVGGLAESPHELMAVVAVDMPFVSPPVLALLARLVGEHDAAIPATAHGLEPVHAVYSVRSLRRLRSSLDAGRLALHEVVGTLDVRRVEEAEWRTADPSGRFAVNVNRPEDVAQVAGPLSQAAGGPSNPRQSRRKETE
jgi:molybdopterin-guanine dinucleotide biosynthesis protein A